MKKASFLASFLVVCMLASAQTHGFRFFPIKDLSPLYQGFVGKIGSHFFLLNRLSGSGLDLYVYDTVSQTGNKRLHPFPRQVTSILVLEKSIVFFGISLNDHKGIDYHYLEVDENGEAINRKKDTLDVIGSVLNTVISPDKQHILFYQYFKRGPDSALVKASLMGADGSLQKTLAYTFKHDKERDDEPETFVDNHGNTHILVYDKYNNYRLSTDLTINTISFDEEDMISETFSLQKMKLKTMNIFQDSSCNCLQAQGTYADGSIKTVRGMYTLSFPAARVNELRKRFSPFTPEMIKDFKKGFAATDGGICNSLLLTEMMYTGNGSYAVFRLSSELVQQQETRIRANRLWMDFSATSLVVSRANNWNSPKIIYVKMSRDQGIAWHSIKGQDVFRFTEARYNRTLINGNDDEVLTIMCLADKAEEPQPVLVSIKDGQQVIEKLPEKFLSFSPMQALAEHLYGSIYLNNTTREGGILLIHPVQQ
jgi:hypothetical protein